MNKFLTASILALAGVALSAPSAKALSYSDGDIILAFRGTSTSYLVNLGPVTQFQTGSLVDGNLHTLSLSGVNADLNTLYGGSNTWGASGSTLLWSLQGSDPFGSVPSPASTATVWISQKELTAGTASPALQNDSQGALQGPAGLISDMGSNGYSVGTATANNSVGLLQANTAGNSYRSYQSGGSNITTTAAYDYFSTSPEGSFANGAANNVLDLYQLDPNQSGNALRLGAFGINATTGAIQFSSDVSDFAVAPVPEPTTIGYGLVMLGACGLRRFRSRRSVQA